MVDKKIAKPTSFTLGTILRVLSYRGELEKCEEIFEMLRKRKEHSLFTYTQMVNVCIKRDDLEKALTVILEMKKNGIEPHYGIFIPMLKATTASKNVKLGLKMLELVDDSNVVSIQVSMCVITFSLQANIPEKAIVECEKLKKHKFMTVITWSRLMQAHIQMNQVEKAIQLLDEMEKDGIKPDSTTFTILIAACATNNLIEQGEYLHNLTLRKLNSYSIELITSIMNFYIKHSQPEKAVGVFESMKRKTIMNVISWNYLIHAHIDMNQVEMAIRLLDEMEKDNVLPNSTTFTILITACTSNKLIYQIEYLHTLILKHYTNSVEISNTILNLYIKHNLPDKAVDLFERRKRKIFMDLISWNCLMQAYIQMNQVEKAIQLLDEMEKDGIQPDSITFTILITACANNNLFKNGDYIHNTALKLLGYLNFSVELVTATMNFYTKHNRPEKAIELGEHLRCQRSMNVVTWSCLMQAYVQMNQVEKAIQLLDEMEKDNILPNSTTFTILLTACAKNSLLKQGEYLYRLLNTKKLITNIEVTNSIVNMFVKCNHPEKAIGICEELRNGKSMNVVTWSCLMQAYIQMNQVEKAIHLLDEMEKDGIQPDSITFTILITACANNNLIEQGKKLHNVLLRKKKLSNIEIINSIINMYVKCNQPEKAIKVFEKTTQKQLNRISWNCLMQAYIQMNQVEKAIQLLDEMEKDGIQPDSITFTILITACADNNLIEQGVSLFNRVQVLDKELLNSVINMYVKCNQSEKALELVKKTNRKELMNTVSWNCLMQAYIQMNQVEKAIQLLDIMEKDGIKPNSTTFTILITACANHSLIEKGEYLHNLALSIIDNVPIELLNSIVNFYTKSNNTKKAIEECKKIQEKGLMNIVSWNSLINAYVQAMDILAAINSFQQMKQENIEPNTITFTILLSGCGNFVSQEKGLSIIEEIKSRGLEMEEEIISSMINFYSKIGEQVMVGKLFKTLRKKYSTPSIITYNNMLSHYAHHGNGTMAMNLFDEMIQKNIQPNDQTFTIILNAYSHSGMVTEAINFFNNLQLVYNHTPSPFNIGAMIDVYSRAGMFDQAEALIGDGMDFIWWNTIMGGCRKFNNVELGERVFNKLILIQHQEASPYILMSNIYTYHCLNEKAEMIRNLMEKNGIKKTPGIVYHEENGYTYKFVSGSTNYERYEEVEKMREKIYRKIIRAGFKPDIKWVTNTKSLTEREKINALCKHAEKTAIAHALVLNPKRKKILLTKNLRVCNDCHNATEFISKVFNIEIIVRDASRYHHFVNGKCSCNNYW